MDGGSRSGSGVSSGDSDITAPVGGDDMELLVLVTTTRCDDGRVESSEMDVDGDAAAAVWVVGDLVVELVAACPRITSRISSKVNEACC